MTTRTYSVFLLLPKFVDGRLTWLKKVRCTETIEHIFIGGTETERVYKEYHLI